MWCLLEGLRNDPGPGGYTTKGMLNKILAGSQNEWCCFQKINRLKIVFRNLTILKFGFNNI